MHAELLAEHGGLAGVRDPGALEASMDRPRNRHAYGGRALASLAAAYAYAFARNHPFNDGNKRMALATLDVFLRLNGQQLTAPEVEAVVAIRDLAAGELAEEQLADWISRNSSPLG